MSYIEREALLKNSHTYSMDFGEYIGEDVRDVDAILTDRVKEAPAADVAPVAHGRWKYYHKQNKAVCTNCSFERDLDANFGAAVSCPNCGCRMDGGEKREAD